MMNLMAFAAADAVVADAMGTFGKMNAGPFVIHCQNTSIPREHTKA